MDSLHKSSSKEEWIPQHHTMTEKRREQVYRGEAKNRILKETMRKWRSWQRMILKRCLASHRVPLPRDITHIGSYVKGYYYATEKAYGPYHHAGEQDKSGPH